MKTLSVIILTYNEENYIEDAIKSVAFANEIIILDSGSKDNTVAIASKYDCILASRNFDNYCNQRNFALSLANSEWILFLDADERVYDKLEKEILQAISIEKHLAFKIWFPHLFMGRFLFHYTDKVVRLFKNHNFYFVNHVHEKLVVNFKVGLLKNYMIHDTYKDIYHFLDKKDNYAWIQAKMRFNKNKKTSLFLLIFKPFYRFFHTYFIKRVFLDGIPGLASASFDAYGVFSRHAKLYLLEKNLK